MASSTSRLQVKRKKFLGNRSDVGWEHYFEVDGNPRKVRCKYCDKTMSGGVYRLKHHLDGSHLDTISCPNVPNDVKNKMMEHVSKSMDILAKKKQGFFGSDDDVEMSNASIGGTRSNESVQLQPKKGTIESMLKKIHC